jgi:single-stranded DNA-binding protein
MMHSFAAGELVRDPERRQTKAGHDYATALVRCEGDTLVSVTAFEAELAERLLDLRKGDPLAVAGRLTVSAYLDKQGEPRAGLQVTVTGLMAAPVRVTET